MRRLLFMLAWAECRRASWFLAAGEATAGEVALATAGERLRTMGAVKDPPRRRPVLGGARHGLQVVRSSRRCG